jgi:hypothetical protein
LQARNIPLPYVVNRGFCKQWNSKADLHDRQFCRKCGSQPCQALWLKVKALASLNNNTGIQASTLANHKPFRLFTTSKQSPNHCYLQVLSSDRVGVVWGLPKEDFLYVLKAGDDHTPSHTRQKSHVDSIVALLKTQPGGQELVRQILEV